MERIRENLHLLVLLNTVLILFVLISSSSSNLIAPIIVNADDKKGAKLKLREVICKEAFKQLRARKLSTYYYHSDVIDELKEDSTENFTLGDNSTLYFSFEGREICKVVAKMENGFRGFEAVIGSGGPLLYRVTSIRSIKPEYKDVKEYL